MSMQYVRDTYNVPVKRGGLVRYFEKRSESDSTLYGVVLVVTRCTNVVHARERGMFGLPGHVRLFHPTDLEYLTKDGWYSPVACGN